MTPHPANRHPPGLAALGTELGLPMLPDAEFRLFTVSHADPQMIEAVSRMIVDDCSARRQ